jgi:hypothetical protein
VSAIQYCIRIRFPFRCYSYNYNHNSQSLRRIAAESNRKPRWRFGQEVNSTSSWYTRSLSRVRKSHTSFVLSVSCCGKWTLFINFDKLVWKPGEIFLKPAYGLPVLNVFLELPRPGYISDYFKKRNSQVPDCINNWTLPCTETLLKRTLQHRCPAYWDSIGLVDETCSEALIPVWFTTQVGVSRSRF